jgi:hypothetical protein
MKRMGKWIVRHRRLLAMLLFIAANHLFDGGAFDMLVNVRAQGAVTYTNVTGTITDPNGLPYSFATINVQLAPAPPGAANCGTNTLQTLGKTAANASGFFQMALCPNASITPAGSQWQFNVSIAPGIPIPAGTGPQSFSVLITIAGASQDVSTTLSSAAPALSHVTSSLQQGTTNPSCISGQAFLFLNTATNQLLSCNNGILSTASGAPATTIDMKQYGVVADLRTCLGVEATFTNGSPNLTCTVGAFCNGTTVACPAGQTSDVGKRINATIGCCNASVPVSGVTQALPNNTTILSVTDSTHIVASQNFTLSSTTTNPYVYWATDDDAAVAAADAAYIAAPVCTAMLWPATPFLVKNPHFNSPNAQCEQLESGGGVGRIATGSYMGWGSSNSVMYLDSSFPATTSCTFGANSNGCFFSYAGTHLMHLGISGGWNQKPNGGGHSYSITNPNSSADWIDVRLSGWDTANGSTNGIFAQSFSNFKDVYLEGFGFNGINYSGQITEFDGGYAGNVGGHSLTLGGSPGASPVTTKSMSFGTSGASTVLVAGGPWYSYADTIYGLTTAGTCIDFTGAGVGTNAYINGDVIASQGNCTTQAFFVTNNAKAFVQNSTIGGATHSIVVNAGGTFVDQGGNTYAGGAPTLTGSFIGEANSANAVLVTAAKLVLSAGWGSTAANTALSGGDFPIQFTITNSGTGQAASPTITYTFPTPLLLAPYSCTATQTGGTNATGTFTSGAPSTTGVTFTFSLTPTASSTEIVVVTCVTP